MPDEKPKQNGEEKKPEEKKDDAPAGGYDDTPIPHAPPGYTVKFTFHRATNLPMADVNTLSSDPYVLAQLETHLPTRHKEDPALRWRTPTIRRDCDPVWNSDWIVANVPSSGFKLKIRLYDEDPADADDRLGNVHVNVGHIDESWPGIHEGTYKIRKRMGSKRAYLARTFAVCFGKTKHMHGNVVVSVQCLGRTEAESGGRVYTIGPQLWWKHYSPMLGRLAHTEDKQEEGEEKKNEGKNTKKYNFQANQFQLQGPVPEKLYHRFVEFKPFVKQMFTKKGAKGWLLGSALHHQHTRVYNYSRSTEWGTFNGPCKEMTEKFLDLVHYDEGGRIFTYVITLDALWRFTETGKEFGIDMLSKHTMHSDVNIYIAFSGEFFIRRLKYPNKKTPEEGGDSENPEHPPDDISGGPPDKAPPKDPSYYELVIDNDSGTYRPNAKLLPQLKAFLSHQLPGLHVATLDCQADAEKMDKMKNEQRERKKKEGQQVLFRQPSSDGSISSSDEEALDEMEAEGQPRDKHLMKQMKHDAKAQGSAKMAHVKGYGGQVKGHRGHPDGGEVPAGETA